MEVIGLAAWIVAAIILFVVGGYLLVYLIVIVAMPFVAIWTGIQWAVKRYKGRTENGQPRRPAANRQP
jgi:hypothetical protein